MASIEHQVPSCSYNAVDTFGEPEILPRVGNEYQAELPQLLENSSSFSHSMDYADDEIRDDFLQNFHVGSPTKIAWIRSSRTSSGLKQSEAKNIKEAQISFCELDLSHDLMEESENLPRLVPEICDGDWTTSEKDCFLLGLYIFSKNFVEVKKFVGTKDMGALQSYYYGRFYSSPEHHRWSKTQKMKHKKGHGIFSGLRLQEFLSRLLPRVGGECQNALLEVSKSFENEKISMAEYVFSLKAMIGAELLVEAVGIGKPHQDLTAMAMGHLKSNLSAKMRHNLPSENVFSSLKTAEIMNFLNGEHRLSKARSNDLFWDAVWPRLLENGWHSEQHTSYKHIGGSSPSLVFLKPGVKKFSRRNLVRGSHYFDSLSDVLSKIAREPALLELNLEDVDCCNEVEGYEVEVTKEGTLKENDENHSISSLAKFTVVDTGISDGNVVKLRNLPSDAENSPETPNEATLLGKKRARDDVSSALVHKKRKKDMQENTQDEDQDQAQTRDEVTKNLDIIVEEVRPQLLIDLNLPPVPLDNEDGSDAAEAGHEQDITPNKVKVGEQYSSSNPIRYSSRHRPPTMRVLEAFARGYLSVNRRQRRKEASTDED